VADRRDISIPVNLAFLAALVTISAFVVAPPDDRMTAAVPPEDAAPQPEQAPATLPVATDMLRLTAVMMPPVPEAPKSASEPSEMALPEPAAPQLSPQVSRQASSQPAPARLDLAQLDPGQPGLARPEKTLAAPDQAVSKPVDLTPLEVASANPAPQLMPRPGTILQTSVSPAPTRPLVPMTPESPVKEEKSLPPLSALAPPVPRTSEYALTQAAASVPVQQAASRPDITPMQPPVDITAPERTPPERTPPERTLPERASLERVAAETTPQASDWQVANRLMDTAAQRLSLEFLWPADRQSHASIYTHLTACLGVETGLIDPAGRVHLGSAGSRSFNTAMHSPFMRLVDRPVDPREDRAVDRIKDRQGAGTGNGRVVRVFRRAHDMRLLAALNRAFGGLPATGRVTAEYRMNAGALYLDKLTLDGRRYEGRIRLDQGSCA